MGLLLHYARDLLQRFAVAVFHNVFSGLELIVHIVFEDSSTTVLNSGRTLERLQPKFQRLWEMTTAGRSELKPISSIPDRKSARRTSHLSHRTLLVPKTLGFKRLRKSTRPTKIPARIFVE